MVYYLQLRDRTAFDPDLGVAVRTVLPDLADVHDLLTRTLVALRLVAPDSGVPGPAARLLLGELTGESDIEAALGLAKRRVIEAWSRVFGSKRQER